MHWTKGVAVVLMGVGVVAQAPDPTKALVERAGKYVDAYLQQFSALVCEEQQEQRMVRIDGRVSKTRRLRSDFLLVNVETAFHIFRDVLEVDGKPVRNREDRLRKLFLETPRTALEQARAIATESGRHNIGFRRVGDSPILPLRILSPAFASGFTFTRTENGVAFEEVRSPTYMAQRRGNKRLDLPARGSFVIDPATGAVLAAELSAEGPPPSIALTMNFQYREDPALKMLVPIALRVRAHQVHKPKDDRLEVDATYSNFRRFEVTVQEQVKIPK